MRVLQKCIECEESDREKAENYREMGRLFKDTDPHKFIEYSKQALEMNVIAGRTSAAANIAKELATSLEENY